MGFGGGDGCVRREPRPFMFGECPFHPGNPMLHCPQCVLMGVAEKKTVTTKTCDLVGCDNPVTDDATYCSLECVQHAMHSQYEFVDHPKHYNEHPAGIECIDVIEHMTHNVGAAVKYLWRVGLKPGEGYARDLDKAIWYINREKERLAKEKK